MTLVAPWPERWANGPMDRRAAMEPNRIALGVKLEKPDLHDHVRQAGMLCCRRVRRKPGETPSKNFSNHSWGTAIDLQFGPQLDEVGDGLTQLGLLQLAPFLDAEGFYWGAGFGGATEDAMHFEASDELVRPWAADGHLGTS